MRTSSARARTTCRLVKRPSTIKEVLDVDGMWVGPAPAADHVRCAGGGVGRVVAGPCVAAGSGTVPTMAPGRRDSSSAGRAGGVGGGGLHGLAVCRRRDCGGGVRGPCRRAGDTKNARGRRNRAKTDRTDARLTREL